MTEVVLSKSTLIISNYSSFVKNTASHKSLNMNHAYDGGAIAAQDGTVWLHSFCSNRGHNGGARRLEMSL